MAADLTRPEDPAALRWAAQVAHGPRPVIAVALIERALVHLQHLDEVTEAELVELLARHRQVGSELARLTSTSTPRTGEASLRLERRVEGRVDPSSSNALDRAA